MGLFDPNAAASESLAERLGEQYPDLEVTTGSKDPEGYDIVVNATPLGMNDDDPLPMDVDRISPGTFVGEVVMKQEITPFLQAAQGQGLPDPGRQRHALRDDPGLPGVLRVRDGHPRGAARRLADHELMPVPDVSSVSDERDSVDVTEVAPGVHRLALPLGIHGVPTVSAYLLHGGRRRQR